MSANGSSGASILLAFIGGAAVGAAVALLAAPQSGAETRQQIAGMVRRRQKQLSQLPPAVREAYGAATEAARTAFHDAYQEQLDADKG